MLQRPVAGACGAGFYGFCHFDARCYHPEYGVFGIEEMIIAQVDEKLAAIGVGASIGHRYSACGIAVAGRNFIIKFIARAACTPHTHLGIVLSKRVAALYHKIFDNTVKFHAVIKAHLCQLYKISNGIGCLRIV